MTFHQPGKPLPLTFHPHAWRWLLPVLMILLFLAIMLWLPFQMQRMEVSEREEQLIADTLWVEQTIRLQLSRDEESVRVMGDDIITRHVDAKQLGERLW